MGFFKVCLLCRENKTNFFIDIQNLRSSLKIWYIEYLFIFHCKQCSGLEVKAQQINKKADRKNYIRIDNNSTDSVKL